MRGADRSEVQLLPPCLDDYVAADSACRFIDAYVEGLDFQALGFGRAQPAATGRPGYHPGDLLKLYLYGYLNRVRSSRRLEAEAQRNLEVIWLLRGLRPDFKTIADFRKDNRAAFKALFKEFNLLCRRLDLFGAELVAIDGSKFKADNSSYRRYTPKELRELIVKIESRIDDYLSQCDHHDDEGGGGAGASDLPDKLEWLRQNKGRYQQLLGELEQSGQSEISTPDAEARLMMGPHGYVLGYNVQVAVDAKHGLIAAQDVTQSASDTGQLAPLAVAAKEQTGAVRLKAVADKGYYNGAQLEACEQAAVEPIVPKPTATAQRDAQGRRLFGPERFPYDPASDTYQCPAGQPLAYSADYGRPDHRLAYYQNRNACRRCPIRRHCTTGLYRTIVRSPHQAAIERAAQRVRDHPHLLQKRKGLAEPVFGLLRLWGHDRFLLRGLEKVRAEFSLSALTYNLRRVLNLLGPMKLQAALR
jgi:transposase